MCPYEDPRSEALDRAECLRLLGSVEVGRVAYTSGALPAVQPVTFTLHRGQIVFRTLPGSALDGALRDTIVAFEADEYDGRNHSGWSVTAVGPATVVRDQELLAELSTLPLQRWPSSTRENFVTIAIELVHGRRTLANGRTRPPL